VLHLNGVHKPNIIYCPVVNVKHMRGDTMCGMLTLAGGVCCVDFINPVVVVPVVDGNYLRNRKLF
jgi:hypothetical protein